MNKLFKSSLFYQHSLITQHQFLHFSKNATGERKIKVIDNKSMNWCAELSQLNGENVFVPLFISKRPHLFKHKFNQYFPLLVFGGSLTNFGMHALAGAYVKSGLWLALGGISWIFRQNIHENLKIIVRKMDVIKCGTVVRIVDMLGEVHEYPIRQLRKPTEAERKHLKGMSAAAK